MLRVILKLLAMFLWLAFMLPLGLIARLFKHRPTERWFAQTFLRGIAGIMGIRITVEGEMARERPLLIVTNHSSYLDVVVLGSIGDIVFTPKSEIEHWPIVGLLSKLDDSVFIDRRVSKTAENQQRMRERMEKRQVMCLFPEGTTNNGRHLNPFRSSYFSLADEKFYGAPLTVQPAAVAYTCLNGLPVDSSQRALVAWYGDMELAPHLKTLLRYARIDVRLSWLPPTALNEGESRKELAERCRSVISASLQAIS